MRGCSPLIELMNGTLPPASMMACTPASSALGLAESTMSCMSVTPMTMSMSQSRSATSSPPATPPLTSMQTGAGVDLILGQGLDELGIARLDRLGDLLARPVDRFTHQQHLNNLHDDYPGRTTVSICEVLCAEEPGRRIRDGEEADGAGRAGRPDGQTPSGGGTIQSGRRRRRSEARRSPSPGPRGSRRRSATRRSILTSTSSRPSKSAVNRSVQPLAQRSRHEEHVPLWTPRLRP